MLTTAIAMNLGFFLIASLYVAIGARRAAGTAAFPGPRPVPAWFKAWLVVIWAVGMVLPLAALAVDGVIGANQPAAIAIGFYILMFVMQIATELVAWKRWRSPVWVIVPCLYLTWRMFQCYWGLTIIDADATPLTAFTLYALMVLWAINIGVHFTNIPLSLRWDYHPKSASFPALHRSVPVGAGHQDSLDPGQGAKQA